MESEKKGKKVLEIILIIIVALSFVLIPLLNQYRNKTISLNNTQLVKRQNERNGTIDISDYKFGKVYTITSSFKDLTIYTTPNFGYQNILDGSSLTGTTDDFGYGFNNYFRFTPISIGTTTYFVLQYYLSLNSNNVILYNLGYYSAFEDSDSNGDFITFNCITRTQLENLGVAPTFNVLNFMFYNGPSLDLFLDFCFSNDFGKLLSVENDYKYPSNILTYVIGRNTKFINLEQDFVTSLLSTAQKEGYDEGYNKGFADANSTGNVFETLRKAVYSLTSFFNIEILPNFSMWMLLSIPFACSIMIILFKLLRGDN